MSVADDGISVVRWAEAVRLMTELLPHVDKDDVEIYQDVVMLVTKKLLETGDKIVNNSGSR